MRYTRNTEVRKVSSTTVQVTEVIVRGQVVKCGAVKMVNLKKGGISIRPLRVVTNRLTKTVRRPSGYWQVIPTNFIHLNPNENVILLAGPEAVRGTAQEVMRLFSA